MLRLGQKTNEARNAHIQVFLLMPVTLLFFIEYFQEILAEGCLSPYFGILLK